jgi:branched-chain amino acid aminotransferase
MTGTAQVPVAVPEGGIEPAVELTRRANVNPGHGAAFTAHVYSMQYTPELGWHAGELLSLDEVSLHPATIGVHYAQVIYEGLKAFRQVDGTVALFRPLENARRFRRSAARLAMPELPEELFLHAVEKVVQADEHELSDDPEHSLYVRPMMLGTDMNLILRPSENYRFLVMAFVAAGYFGDKLKPVSVWVSRTQSRAMPYGTGDVKCAANYGPTFVAQREAQRAGCQQVVWLDSVEHRWVEEIGSGNLFFVRGSGDNAVVCTTPLTGTLLPGITRDSLLQLAVRLGYQTDVRPISVEEWRAGCEAGAISEVFVCGTAAVVTPVGGVRDGDGGWTVGDGQLGPVTERLRAALVDQQHGRTANPPGWLHKVERTTG